MHDRRLGGTIAVMKEGQVMRWESGSGSERVVGNEKGTVNAW